DLYSLLLFTVLVSIQKNHRLLLPRECQHWTLYLGSEIGLMILIALLGVPPDMLGYASHLGFQLNWNNGKPEIYPLLNLKAPGCPNRCSLDQWLKVLQEALPTNWEALCARGKGRRHS
ncbi:MAG: hypothetical protein ACPG5T_05605, partial [Endozoicomonas sp.]